MRHRPGHHLAEFNLGILKHDWDDPRVQDFVDALDRVNGVARRSPGFVWMLDAEEMERAQLDPTGPLGGHPRLASTLSVWESAADLEHFVWQTVHRQYYDRRAEWYDMEADALRMVLWWVPAGHRPDVAEAMARFRHLERHGESETAFGWASLQKTAQAPAGGTPGPA
jgi:hypothetical protein